MALATGGDTHKMKYGHRGGNHPVKDLATGRVYISSQNHGYVVDAEGLEEKTLQNLHSLTSMTAQTKVWHTKERISLLYSSILKHARDRRIPVTCLTDLWI